MQVPALLLRCLLLLALWPGMPAWAQAGGDASCARHAHAAMPPAVATAAAPGLVRAAGTALSGHPAELSLDDHGVVPAAGHSDTCTGHAAGGAHPDCCQGGACGCRCAAPAVASAVFLATPVPVAHDPVVARFDYQPSHLLPQPYRPPIA